MTREADVVQALVKIAWHSGDLVPVPASWPSRLRHAGDVGQADGPAIASPAGRC